MDNDAYEKQALKEDKNGSQKDDVEIEPPKLDLIYSIYDTPPWYLSIFLGFQHFLTAFGANVTIPFLLIPLLCNADDVVLAEIINTSFFISGLVTTLQTLFGTRLPIIQGGTFAFLTPAFAILSLEKWQCPGGTQGPGGNGTDDCGNPIPEVNATGSDDETGSGDDEWKLRMRELQGAIILASLFQVVIGATGMVGIMLRFIGPLVIAPTIALIGIALFGAAADFCSDNWYIALMTMVFIIAFSQYLRDVDFPCCIYKKRDGCKCSGYPLFKLFPIILSICLSWTVCAILTVTDAIPDDPDHWAYPGRTDTKIEVISDAKWFRVPYPGQWGVPTFSTAGVFGMLSGVVAGMIESIGDYYACARLAGAPPPPVHAINRGIFIEGIGCVIAGCFGTGTGTTSYSENIGAIGITKVGSTRVVLFGGLIMIVLGTLGKFGAIFVTIPNPIIGGVFMVMFGMISAVGISNLQFVDMNSSRNLFVFGFSLFFGLSFPQWINANQDSIDTGNDTGDQIVTVLLSTSMFVGGAVAFILDNTIPGTDEERGINVWRKVESNDTSGSTLENNNTSGYACYDLPFGMSAIRKSTWLKYIPISPTFDGCNTCTGSSKDDGAELNGIVVDRGYEGDSMDLRQRKNTDASSTQL